MKNAAIGSARAALANDYQKRVDSIKNVTLTQLLRTFMRLGTLPTEGGGELASWVPRATQDGAAYFNKDQSFPTRLVTDPAALEKFISNGLTGKENLSSTPFSTHVGSFATTLTRSAIMDLLLGKISFRFSNSTLRNATGIRAVVEMDVVLPVGPAIAIKTLTSYWEGSVVTANGSPILDFIPWLETFDSSAPSGGGNAVVLQDYIARPIEMPCTDQLTPPAVLTALPLKVNQTNEVRITLTSSDPALQTDMLIATGTSTRMVDFRKALAAAATNNVVANVYGG